MAIAREQIFENVLNLYTRHLSSEGSQQGVLSAGGECGSTEAGYGWRGSTSLKRGLMISCNVRALLRTLAGK